MVDLKGKKKFGVWVKAEKRERLTPPVTLGELVKRSNSGGRVVVDNAGVNTLSTNRF
jgi:hypothetical protein